MPRDSDPEVGNIKGVTLVNIDDLQQIVEENIRFREGEAERARVIIEEEIRSLEERFTYLSTRPVMVSLSDKAEHIREREQRKALAKIGHLTEEEEKIIDHMTHMIVRKLLREPMIRLIVIATRKSLLAMWQAEYVAARIRERYPETAVELLPVSTRGDEILSMPLAEIGGKGLFIKELEYLLLEGKADLAVHSLKDMPAELAPDFTLAAVTAREDPRDAFVSLKYGSVEELPAGAKVGTSSLRRQSQLLHRRGDLAVASLRGNVQTRLRKLDEGQYDAVILAARARRPDTVLPDSGGEHSRGRTGRHGRGSAEGGYGTAAHAVVPPR